MNKRVALAGATGRMGRAIVAELSSPESGLSLIAAVARKNSQNLAQDSGLLSGQAANGVLIVDQLDLQQADVLIEFTLPENALGNLEQCAEAGVPAVVGTTGFSESELTRIEQLAQKTAIVLSPNMSIGVNLTFHLLQQAAAVIGHQADIEITETHHRNKLDAPSGTAIKMGQVIAEAIGTKLEDVAEYTRHGSVDQPRQQSTIGFSTIRAGDVIGDHTVMYALAGERIEISHKATNRSIYARGALQAAQWVIDQGVGLYDMQDVLGLRA